MNRVGLGLAIGAGYVLGRTKKLKLALALGTLAAGKRMQLSPKALMDLASQQLRDNPQLKEIAGQVREDLRGVGKAASGAMVERQVDALADRLHGRTAEVRDQLAGVVPGGLTGDREDEEAETDGHDDAHEDSAGEEPEESERADDTDGDAEARTGKRPAKKAPAKKARAKTSARNAAPRKTAAKKTSAARSRVPKGGRER
ncbi:DNA primase [Streptomyces sp. NPDC026672]|uniref:DNA primase n=1 Tax=unclassified Streptomyces TaxID=2593676 RepID=UPI0033CDF86C